MKKSVKILGILVLIVLTLSAIAAFAMGGVCVTAAQELLEKDTETVSAEHPVLGALVTGIGKVFGSLSLLIIGIMVIVIGFVAIVFDIVFAISYAKRSKGYKTTVIDVLMLLFNIAVFIGGIAVAASEGGVAAGLITMLFAAICGAYAAVAVALNRQAKKEIKQRLVAKAAAPETLNAGAQDTYGELGEYEEHE